MSYDEIKILSDREHVRRRPAMYISSEHPMLQMVTEILDNACDEAQNGYAQNIHVEIDYDTSTVTVADDGRGLPQGTDGTTGKTYAELIYCKLNAGGKFDQGNYAYSSGLHGVGSSVVNFLSKEMEVLTNRGTMVMNLKFMEGECVDVKRETIKVAKGSGTTVRFKIDTSLSIFEGFSLRQHTNEIMSKLQFLASMIPTCQFYYNTTPVEPWKGRDFLGENFDRLLPEDLVFETIEGKLHAKVVINWALNNKTSYWTYANLVTTTSGGDHSLGVREGLCTWYGNGDIGGLGLQMFVSVMYPGIEYDGQSKSKALSKEMRTELRDWIVKKMNDLPAETQEFIRADIKARRDKINGRNTKKKRTKNNRDAFNSAFWSGGFADCSSPDRQNCTLFIVEGQSAGGSVRQCRDPETQAVFPVRGKILNASTHSWSQIEKNKEIQGIRQALDCGYRDNVNPEECRYGRIVFLTDGDIDGSHIRTLLTSVFYWCFRPLLEAGMVYCAQPPLYSMTKGKQRKWTSDRDEMIRYQNKGWDVQRLKGLGEQQPEDLYASTLSDTSELVQLRMEDGSGAMIEAITGSDPDARRRCLTDAGVLW